MNLDPLVSALWLFQNLNNPDLIILDASPSKNVSNLIPEYTTVQIKGARKFDIENVFVDTKNELPNMFPSSRVFEESCQNLGINKQSIIVVYDNLGIYTSPRAWWMFKSMGHSKVAVLDGGLSEWVKNEYPVEAIIKAAYIKGNFKSSYEKSFVISSNKVLENIQNQKCLVVDARSAGRFSGLMPEPRENMESGHIPNSINIPFENVLNNGKMKSREELISIFKVANQRNADLIFTCGSGITACIILLASVLSGCKSSVLFDGSWAEWGQKGMFPVDTIKR